MSETNTPKSAKIILKDRIGCAIKGDNIDAVIGVIMSELQAGLLAEMPEEEYEDSVLNGMRVYNGDFNRCRTACIKAITHYFNPEQKGQEQ